MNLLLTVILSAPTEDAPAATESSGIAGLIQSYGGLVVLALAPILAWLAARKRDKPTQEQGFIQEVQEERKEMKTQRDEAIATNKELDKQLKAAESLVLQMKVDANDMRIELANARAANAELQAELTRSRQLNAQLTAQIIAGGGTVV